MKTKFGSVIVAGSGKIGGHVASRNRAGSYLRTKVTPVNPRTASQSIVRNRLATAAQAWRGLTAAQRDAWQAAVATFAKTDIFGDIHNPSGFNLYCKIQNNLSIAGSVPSTLPPTGVAVASTNIVSLTSAFAVAALSLTMSALVPTLTHMVIRATPAMSAGKNFVKSELRQIARIAPAGTAVQDLLTAWQAKYGTIPAAGLKIFVEVLFINDVTGVQSGRQRISCIIAA